MSGNSVEDTSKYPIGIRLAIILTFPTIFWIAVISLFANSLASATAMTFHR